MTSTPSPAAPADPTPTTVYREKLTPAWWMWLLYLGLGCAVCLALAPISVTAGIVAGVLAAGTAAAVSYARAREITVSRHWLQVGRARIEPRFIGAVEAFTDPEDVRRARGPELDARAYMCFSASVPGMCRIEITDPVDPTPYWLAASRRPHELAEAIASVAGSES